MKIGIDIGKVIIGGNPGDDTTFFTDQFLDTPEVTGAYKSVAALRKKHEVHFVSKCGLNIELKTVDWLNEYGYASMLEGRTHFVRRRELKAPMAEALQLDIFIDDRIEILQCMEGIVEHRIQFSSWEQVNAELAEILKAAEEEIEEELG